MSVEVESTARNVTVTARKTVTYELPYDRIRVVLPRGEKRRVTLRGVEINLHADAS